MEKPSWVLKMPTMEKRAGVIWSLGPREQAAARGSAQWLRARDDDGREQRLLLSPERCADARGAQDLGATGNDRASRAIEGNVVLRIARDEWRAETTRDPTLVAPFRKQ
ncbi:hypothetical protein U1Q18_003206 [Sarracenia purpurea var. burkii]